LRSARVPNTDDLGLERTAVTTDKRGYITVDDQLRTNVDGIWAMGDCNGRGAFTHTAFNDAEIVPPTCSTTTRAASPIAFPPTRFTSIRRSVVVAKRKRKFASAADRLWLANAP
jgi:pyruvate/2-oxoglutarate dehydrogenase complex dihydrolipoamide dehydrogenase (E3) component